jgi:prepilin-type N-terminal cleavage/methylation domain-containing protein
VRRSLIPKGGGFTLIELVIVIVVIGVALTALAVRTGSVAVYQQRGFLRDLKGTLEHLHYQAIADRSYYGLEVNFKNQSFRAGVLQSDQLQYEDEEFARRTAQLGIVSTELNSFLNPSLGSDYSLIPPPTLEALFDERTAPEGLELRALRTTRGIFSPENDESALILFSPRGFSEFAAITIKLRSGLIQTWRVNPFTGRVDVYEGERDFDFSFEAGEKLVEM